MHPRRLRCSSLKYSRYSRSSRLAGGAPHPSRCDARLSPRAVTASADASTATGWPTPGCSSDARRDRWPWRDPLASVPRRKGRLDSVSISGIVRMPMRGPSLAPPAETLTTRRLFRASCIALVATAMSFAIRGDIMGDFERLFALSKTDVGWIAGAAFWGFGFSILLGGPLCDLLGMGTLLRLAAIGHIGGVVATIAA